MALPAALGFSPAVRKIYAVEAITLLAYIALTKQPAAVIGVIPFRTHGKIDPFNAARFALQTVLKTFRKDRRAQAFKVAFTLLAGATVLLTNFKAKA